jgi:hypothetical protein
MRRLPRHAVARDHRHDIGAYEAAESREHDHGLDVAAKIERQASGSAEEVIKHHLKVGGDALDEFS